MKRQSESSRGTPREWTDLQAAFATALARSHSGHKDMART
jgi:hypothetical protein